jgi:hypothetical protein
VGFIETMQDSTLDVFFTPAFLQLQNVIKATFCGFYVFFYDDNLTRLILLTILNLLLLLLCYLMHPELLDQLIN